MAVKIILFVFAVVSQREVYVSMTSHENLFSFMGRNFHSTPSMVNHFIN